jgi:NAD(P)H-hydrate epimerase
LKILQANQIREADAATMRDEPISSIDLMERAATACFDWIYENQIDLFPKESEQHAYEVVVGSGNNGGDGLVIARLLQEIGADVRIWWVKFGGNPSEDFATNLNRAKQHEVSIIEIESEKDIPEPRETAIFVDCIFGTGLSRPAEGLASDVIYLINESQNRVISIDLPSGMLCDGATDISEWLTVKADYILTFQCPKPAFFLAENDEFIGELILIDIGLSPDYFDAVKVQMHLLTKEMTSTMLMKRGRFDHKGTFGHALQIAGSEGKRGAAILSVLGALRSGAGLVTLHTDDAGAELLHQLAVEAMASVQSDGEGHWSSMPALAPYNAVGVGPGLGTHTDTARQLKLLIQQAQTPLVIDADALNILADNPTWLAFLPKGSILTPHPGEFARLVDDKLSHYENIQKQIEMSQRFGIYILLKGGRSTLSLPDGQVLINDSGNPGMASGGMGDVLTGILTGLLASGYNPMRAAALGMYIHGLAGDLALKKQSMESLLATDLVNHLGEAFNQLRNDL